MLLLQGERSVTGKASLALDDSVRPIQISAAGRSRPVRLLLADGDRLVRAGLRVLIETTGEIAVVAEAASGREAVALASDSRPDVVLLSVRLPGMDGFEATSRITSRPELSHLGVLILSDDESDEDLFQALRVGASGWLTRDTDPAELVRALRILARGGMEFSPSATRRLIDSVSQRVPQRSTPDVFDELTVRERDVVALVARGLTNDEIGGHLGMSSATAKTHVSRSMVKLHVHDRAKLVALAYQTGFAQLPADRHPANTRVDFLARRKSTPYRRVT
jgi:DNA-binding NarL/FixJ family response regulator